MAISPLRGLSQEHSELVRKRTSHLNEDKDHAESAIASRREDHGGASSGIPRLLPSLAVAVGSAIWNPLLTNPIVRLNTLIVNSIEDHSLNSLSQQIAIMFEDPFRGLVVGIATDLITNNVVYLSRVFFQSRAQRLFPGRSFAYIGAEMLSGAFSGAVTEPLFAVRVRQQLFGTGIRETVEKMLKDKVTFVAAAGTRALRNALFYGISKPLAYFVTSYKNSLSNKVEKLKIPCIQYLFNGIIGGVSAVIAARVAYPLAIVTTLQEKTSETALSIFRNLYRADGLRAFSRGFWTVKALTQGINGFVDHVAMPIAEKLFSKVKVSFAGLRRFFTTEVAELQHQKAQ